MPTMSQHSERTQFGPSRASVVVVGLSTAASAAGTAYMFTMPGFSVRELVACLMGATLAGLLAVHVLGMVGERAVVADRAAREAQRERRETISEHAELNAWQNAAAGLLDAYLTGRAVNFGGEPVPDYVRARLADLPGEPVPTSPAYEDRPPLAPPMYPDRGLDLTEPIPAVREPEVVHDPGPGSPLPYVVRKLRYEEPLGYVAEPRNEDQRVAVPLPPREVPVSPGRGWYGDETEVITRPSSLADPDATEVIERVQ